MLKWNLYKFKMYRRVRLTQIYGFFPKYHNNWKMVFLKMFWMTIKGKFFLFKAKRHRLSYYYLPLNLF